MYHNKWQYKEEHEIPEDDIISLLVPIIIYHPKQMHFNINI